MTLRELEDRLDRLENLLNKERINPRLRREIDDVVFMLVQAINQDRLKAATRFLRFTRYFEPARN